MTTINSAQAVSRDQDGDVHDNNDPATRPTRRTFSTEEKLALLAAYEACDPGKKGEFARREGIYSSQLTEWRRARDAGTLAARESTASRRDRREFDKLEKRNKKLEAELERTRLALDIVGKAHALLEKLSESRGQRVVVDQLMTAFHEELRPLVGEKKACALLGRVRSSYYRLKKPMVTKEPVPRASPPNSVSETERAQVLALLCEENHVDSSVAQVYAETLDEGTYLYSQSTMLRILRANRATKDRRRQRTHPAKKRPELLATASNEIWSWDISKLHGPTRGLFYDLYVVIDIFSRYVPGWLVAAHEDAELAKEFLEDAVATQGVPRDQLTIHADRGGSMRSKPVSQLMMDLGVTRSHSRPHVSNDNPFSETAFKTLKYCPTFPERFGCIEDARAFCDVFFDYYNHVHRHSGIGLHTPASVHYGTHTEIREQRQTNLTSAFELNPIRFRRIAPQAPTIPEVVWINPPIKEVLANI